MALFDLGLTQEEFFLLQPRQLRALIRRWERAEENREYMPAQIAACVVNYSMAPPEKPKTARDFMPTQWRTPRDTHTRLRKVDRELAATQIRGVMDGFMKRAEPKRNG